MATLGVYILDLKLLNSFYLRVFSLVHLLMLTLWWFKCWEGMTQYFFIAFRFAFSISTSALRSLKMSWCEHVMQSADRWQVSKTTLQRIAWRNFWCCCCIFDQHKVFFPSCFHCFISCWGALSESIHMFRTFDYRLMNACQTFCYFISGFLVVQSSTVPAWLHSSTIGESETRS